MRVLTRTTEWRHLQHSQRVQCTLCNQVCYPGGRYHERHTSLPHVKCAYCGRWLSYPDGIRSHTVRMHPGNRRAVIDIEGREHVL